VRHLSIERPRPIFHPGVSQRLALFDGQDCRKLILFCFKCGSDGKDHIAAFGKAFL
jgi:hypothetical protein